MDNAAVANPLSAILAIAAQDRTVLPGPPNAPFRREQFLDDGHVWVGIVTTEPGATSPWHHHGEYTTYAYLLDGEATVEFGDDGESKRFTAAEDGLAVIPPGVVHREINSGTTSNRFLIMRVGHGPAVVPVER